MKKDNPSGKIYWHGAFYAVAEAELIDYKHGIQIENEHLLSKEALQVDVLVIKKESGLQMKKNIGRIFKDRNLIEYKSPADTLTISDYNKVNGYGFLYSAFNHVEVDDVTITFVVLLLTPKLRAYLTDVRGFSLEEIETGITYVKGDTFTTQIIEQSKLSKFENLFLSNLTENIQREDISKILSAFDEQGTLNIKNRYVQVIAQLKPRAFREAISMNSYTTELEEVLMELVEEKGITATIKANGMKEVAKKMLRIGEPLEKISLITDLDISVLESLR